MPGKAYLAAIELSPEHVKDRWSIPSIRERWRICMEGIITYQMFLLGEDAAADYRDTDLSHDSFRLRSRSRKRTFGWTDVSKLTLLDHVLD